MLYLIVLFGITSDRGLEIRRVKDGPEINGKLEQVWQRADSTTGFTQVSPYEGNKPSDRTVVYALQDINNLYFAFKCYIENKPFTAAIKGNEDYVKVAIDPFGSNCNAYYFKVHASEVKDDGWLFDDGRRTDRSWDGVWFRDVEMYEDYYVVEIKIPFNSIRYKKDLEKWGLQFERYIAEGRESNYWAEVTIREMDMVSKFGSLTGVKPYSRGLSFEIYPEGFIRYDNMGEGESEITPSLSLNFNWAATSQMSFNATVNPDFAQIESDPYKLNLSRYSVYLEERRPFFLEGKDVFRMSDFGQGKGFFRPLEIFYSRKVGRTVNGEVIPIIGGAKFTSKSDKLQFGMLGAYTDSLTYEDVDSEDSINGVPDRIFGALRGKYSVLENSDVGLLFSGTRAGSDRYNYAVGFDGVYRSGINQFIMQGAMSNRSGKMGLAGSACYFGEIKGLMNIINMEMVQDSFDVSKIGYVPWAGRRKITIVSGPYNYYEKGFFKTMYIGPAYSGIKEPGNENWSHLFGFLINPNFRNNWGFNLEITGGPYYEADTNFLLKQTNLSVWGNGDRYNVNFGGHLSYSYNYRRDYLAYQSSLWLNSGYTLLPNLKASLISNIWIEWDPTGSIEAVTPSLTPRIDFGINADMEVELFNQFVFNVPETRFGETEIISNRFGFIYSWNFRPKSWIYLAVNDYRVKDNDGGLKLRNQVGAVKLKYLIYF